MSMKNLKNLLLFCIPVIVSADWLQHPIWEDGLAEVSIYEGTDSHYGVSRPSRIELITVREFFDPDKLVKTSPRPGKKTLPVMKQNLLQNTRTGVYEYRQMSSSFMHREKGQLLRLRASSQEWCGASSADLVLSPSGEYRLELRNYMDNQGDSVQKLPAEQGNWSGDALILTLKQRLGELKPGPLGSGVQKLRSNNPQAQPRILEVLAVEEISYEAPGDMGSVAAMKVTLKLNSGKQEYVFEKDGPRRLLYFRKANGDEMRLVKTMRLDYWMRNRPGDERLLEYDKR